MVPLLEDFTRKKKLRGRKKDGRNSMLSNLSAPNCGALESVKFYEYISISNFGTKYYDILHCHIAKNTELLKVTNESSQKKGRGFSRDGKKDEQHFRRQKTL